jgi:dTDP-4-dehydrorhamnose 3,5-epimerase
VWFRDHHGATADSDSIQTIIGERMSFTVESLHLGDVVVVVPKIYTDDRGFFMETYRADQFSEMGLPCDFVQENHSRSKKGVLRGLHFQWDPPMGKLMRVTHGAAFLTAVDLRIGSPTFGKWVGIETNTENRRQVWAPAGFARGFLALSEDVEVQYSCTATYNSKAESAIRWDDSEIAIKWPLAPEIVSEKDRNAQTFAQWVASPNSKHFTYAAQFATA